jgi:hypothetical protein
MVNLPDIGVARKMGPRNIVPMPAAEFSRSVSLPNLREHQLAPIHFEWALVHLDLASVAMGDGSKGLIICHERRLMERKNFD